MKEISEPQSEEQAGGILNLPSPDTTFRFPSGLGKQQFLSSGDPGNSGRGRTELGLCQIFISKEVSLFGVFLWKTPFARLSVFDQAQSLTSKKNLFSGSQLSKINCRQILHFGIA